MRRPVLAALLIYTGFLGAGCGGSSASPGAPETPHVLQGQAVSAIDGSATGVVNVQIGTHSAIQTDSGGHFQVDVGAPGTYPTTISGASIIERRTSLTGPSTEPAKVGLIPASYDLQAFNEMFRGSNNRLQRWTTQPSLVIVASVMKYADGAEQFPAIGEQMSDEEVTALASELKQALTWLTAGTFTTFADVDVQRPAAGDQVTVRRPGKIVIGRYTGIPPATHAVGYGSWAEQPDGTVVGGTVWLDRDFDRADSRRWLVRTHELGHALGYSHVTVRPSIMNPSIGPEPTDFDRAGAVIAFQRPVGNTSPDTDPTTNARTFSVSQGALRWSAPIR
jgi:hypothetical protein